MIRAKNEDSKCKKKTKNTDKGKQRPIHNELPMK